MVDSPKDEIVPADVSGVWFAVYTIIWFEILGVISILMWHLGYWRGTTEIQSEAVNHGYGIYYVESKNTTANPQVYFRWDKEHNL